MGTLFCDNPETPEGKYLVLRRDGTVFEHPSFILGARDPASPFALRAYADECATLLLDPNYVAGIRRKALMFERYRKEYGDGDPDAPRHRKDAPYIIALMQQVNKGK